MSRTTIIALALALLGGSAAVDLARDAVPVAQARKKAAKAPPSFDPRAHDPDCIAECSKKQKSCMFTCASIGDETENKECVADCVAAYVACAKACPPRK